MEFWKNSDLGFTCGAFTSQIIEFCIWFYKRLHFLHGTGKYTQISKMMELFVAATEGAMSHNIADLQRIAKQQLDERERWWVPNQTHTDNEKLLRKFGGLHRYFVKLLRNVDPRHRLSRDILNITNKNRHAVTNVVLRKHLRKLGFKHADWRKEAMIINGNIETDANDYAAAGDSGDDTDSDDNDSASSSTDVDSDRYDSDSEFDESDHSEIVSHNSDSGTCDSESDGSGSSSSVSNNDNDSSSEEDRESSSDSDESSQRRVMINALSQQSEVLTRTTRRERYKLLELLKKKNKH